MGFRIISSLRASIIAMNRAPFAPGEWYHCYSRGVDKRITFENEHDYQRFIQLLYLSNSTTNLHRSEIFVRKPEHIFCIDRGERLVSIGAYCLMPNHFHLLLKDETEEGGGISKFMQRIGTAYTMYFNLPKERTGNLFVKPFRSKHVHEDRYFKRVAQYIHFNPIELWESGWKDGVAENLESIENQLRTYRFSSLIDYESENERIEAAVLDQDSVAILKSERPSLEVSLSEAHEYYLSLGV